MATEADFASRVRDGLKKAGCDVERIENRVNLGIPDMLVGVAARFVMIELKVVRSGFKVGMRPHQVAFAVRHASKGRPCFVLVKDEPRQRVCLYSAADAEKLVLDGLRLPPMAEWENRKVDWETMRDLLG